jgi:S1-C subfamily serine protease
MKNITIKSIRAKQRNVSRTAEDFFQKHRDRIGSIGESYRPARFKKFVRFVFLTFFVLVIGGIGGIAIDRVVLPSLLVKYPSLNQYEFLKRVNERTTVIEVTKEVRISEDRAIVEAIKKVSPSVIQILGDEKDENGSYTQRGSGIILTSDGFIITMRENVVQDKTSSRSNEEGGEDKARTAKVRLKDGKIYSAELIGEDLSTGLAVIKIDGKDLPVIALADSESVELGEKLIVINSAIATDIISEFIDDYVPVKRSGQKQLSENKAESAAQKRIKIMNELKDSFIGSAAVNLKGEIVGISQGGNLVIPTSEMNRFVKETMDKQ